jgi:ribonucleoside-diphosphate reductase beta chain
VTDLLAPDTFQQVEEAQLRGIFDIHIDTMIEYVHTGMRDLPDYMELYERYMRQRWNILDIDFTQDKVDWVDKMTEPERDSFLAIASGFHHGERQVEIELPVFMMGCAEDHKIFISSQIEDEARHTVFFDRFYKEVVGLEGDIMDVLDHSYQWISETFVGPFGLLAYQAEELRKNPYDERARVRYATNYFIWIEGVLALAVMKITLGYARQRGFLPGYYTGFTATARDEARHVQGGMRYLQDMVKADPSMLNDVFDTLRTILLMSSTTSRLVAFEPLGLTRDDVLEMLITQLNRKLVMVGFDVPPDIKGMIEMISPQLAGG